MSPSSFIHVLKLYLILAINTTGASKSEALANVTEIKTTPQLFDLHRPKGENRGAAEHQERLRSSSCTQSPRRGGCLHRDSPEERGKKGGGGGETA